jgi:hypothetical protein
MAAFSRKPRFDPAKMSRNDMMITPRAQTKATSGSRRGDLAISKGLIGVFPNRSFYADLY